MEALDLPNIRILGRCPYESVPLILTGFSVAMIPFKMSSLIEATSPIKLFEYLACGLPVISTCLPEVMALEEPGILECEERAGDFAEAARMLHANDDDIRVERRLRIAESFSWKALFSKALDGLSDL
jgi:glycosyltransferase involved in cell wall biosynthesis